MKNPPPAGLESETDSIVNHRLMNCSKSLEPLQLVIHVNNYFSEYMLLVSVVFINVSVILKCVSHTHARTHARMCLRCWVVKNAVIWSLVALELRLVRRISQIAKFCLRRDWLFLLGSCSFCSTVLNDRLNVSEKILTGP